MKEIQDIIAACELLKNCNQSAAIATVVHTAGSVYRRAGARMLLLESGQSIGSISGGCLESDVCDRARSVVESGQPVVAVYDALTNDDLLWGLGLGCNGLVKVLIEPLRATSYNPLTFIAECIDRRHSGVLATVFQTDGLLTTPMGSHLTLSAAGKVTHTLQDAALIEQIVADAQTAARLQQSSTKQYRFPLGNASVWLELIQPPLPLIVFGAGQDAVPVVQFAKALGWHVTVVDRRTDYATRDRFPSADRVMVARPENGLDKLALDARTAAVIMTHNYFDDRQLLKFLLPSSIAYLGLLGPKHRTKQLLEDLKLDGLAVHSSPCHFYTPVGLDIGAETPEAIALAIVAEIQAVVAQRTGSMLRDRPARIHVCSPEHECLPSV
jgi:xanthine dehydrogenase accessory factor